MNMSLDDFIRRKQAGQASNVFSVPRKDKEEIDIDELDAELDLIASKKASMASGNTTRSTISKFDRLSLSDCDEEDDPVSTQNSSIEFAKKLEKMDHPNCCKFKPFTTVETKTRVKVKSQQWRLGNNRTVEDPVSSGVRSGRVGKNYRNNNTASTNVVRGNFTYKLQGDGANKGIAGIVRNNRQRITYNDQPPVYEEDQQIILRKTIRPPEINKDLTVNFDITNLVRSRRLQMRNAFATPYAPPPSPVTPMLPPEPKAQLKMNFDTDDLIKFLQFKKQQAAVKQEDNSGISQYERDAFGGDDGGFMDTV